METRGECLKEKYMMTLLPSMSGSQTSEARGVARAVFGPRCLFCGDASDFAGDCPSPCVNTSKLSHPSVGAGTALDVKAPWEQRQRRLVQWAREGAGVPAAQGPVKTDGATTSGPLVGGSLANPPTCCFVRCWAATRDPWVAGACEDRRGALVMGLRSGEETRSSQSVCERQQQRAGGHRYSVPVSI